MQQLNIKETKEVSGGFVLVIPLVAGGLQALLGAAAVATGAFALQKMFKRHEHSPPVPVMNPPPPKKDDKPDMHHFEPREKKDKK